MKDTSEGAPSNCPHQINFAKGRGGKERIRSLKTGSLVVDKDNLRKTVRDKTEKFTESSRGGHTANGSGALRRRQWCREAELFRLDGEGEMANRFRPNVKIGRNQGNGRV